MYSSCVRDPHLFLFFFNDTATTEIYTLSLHDALPISGWGCPSPEAPNFQADLAREPLQMPPGTDAERPDDRAGPGPRSEEHTSELQSRQYLVCRLLLEKKKNRKSSNVYLLNYINSKHL